MCISHLLVLLLLLLLSLVVIVFSILAWSSKNVVLRTSSKLFPSKFDCYRAYKLLRTLFSKKMFAFLKDVLRIAIEFSL